ncbi:hypothetical protein HJO_06570 [Hyphomonas johnsonii MHS-2]|uniref:DNA-directed DNA polymerase n=2 Tax=Hyphomonas johnsonii TaxID=81031 RepID=A0A059FSB0_9PROT|nr:hypothetical protein HJO_06570 [Hyphomonas johnsonii MHS-2]
MRARRAQPSHTVTASAPDPQVPFVLTEPGAHGLCVVAANAAARAKGISEPLRFADARARVPAIVSEEVDRAADKLALEALAAWMIRIAPLVALDGPDGLMLEVTGCAHLYGGERDMLAQVTKLLDRGGIPHRAGLASTPGAASALARAAPGMILDRGEEEAGLATLPVSALRLSPETDTLLRRFGLRHIGQLYAIDRKALARRFRSKATADAVLLRLDQALGRRIEPIHPLRPTPACAVRLSCPDPLLSADAIRLGLETLAAELCTKLEVSGKGARKFTLHAFRSDGTSGAVGIAVARAVRNPLHILRLFRERVDQLDPGFGIDLLLLEAHRTGPMEAGTVALSGDLAGVDTDHVVLAALADRIMARLGEDVVRIAVPVESHLPERTEQYAPFDGTLVDGAMKRSAAGPRPIRFLSRPEPINVLAEVPDGPPLRFTWRRLPRTVLRADGPERISPEWWRCHIPPPPEQDGPGERVRHLPRARDYYRVEDAAGARYWLFRNGLYDDGRGGPPAWYIHGLFA